MTMIDIRIAAAVPPRAQAVVALLVHPLDPKGSATLAALKTPARELTVRGDGSWFNNDRYCFKVAVAADDWQWRDRFAEGLARALLAANERKYAHVAVILPQVIENDEAAFDQVVSLVDELRYDAEAFKAARGDKSPIGIVEVSFVATSRKAEQRLAARLPLVRAVAEGRMLARRLVDLPPNLLNPEELLREATSLGRLGIKVEALPASIVSAMGGVMAVGRGSAQPPRFIVLELNGKRREAPVVLVGKGVTFDSGGLSLKSHDGMAHMKNDMAGAAAVLGTFSALARVKCRRRVIGLIPAVENMPDGDAFRVGDVLTMFDGRTVEINDTDAEGRLILADALAYAQRLAPRLTIDVATLTGAICVALGEQYSGLFSADAKLRDAVVAAAQRAGERLWPMPLDPLFLDQMKGTLADFRNTSGKRYGGACTAAAFLAAFAPVPWAHLDIAGPVWTDAARPGFPAGATGYGVRTLVHLIDAL